MAFPPHEAVFWSLTKPSALQDTTVIDTPTAPEVTAS
jgi:hypothetical protein